MTRVLIAALLLVLGQAPPSGVSAIPDMPNVDMPTFLEARDGYSYLRVAVVPNQDLAIIITCDDAGSPKCDETWPLLYGEPKVKP